MYNIINFFGLEINGYAEDLYGDVTPIEIISSLGSQWKFAPGHQDVHELFHVVLSALQAEIQHENRVCLQTKSYQTKIILNC